LSPFHRQKLWAKQKIFGKYTSFKRIIAHFFLERMAAILVSRIIKGEEMA